MKQAVIVAHGAPADPMPQEAALEDLAQRVGAHLPGWTLRGATLAAEGALGRKLEGLSRPFVYPFFMAAGWFTGTALPARLREAGAADARQLAPMGTDPALPAFTGRILREAAAAAGLVPRETRLLLAAHGSQVSRRSKDSTYAMAAALRAAGPFVDIEVGLIEEPPFLEDVARRMGGGICLPFFALEAGHTGDDVPGALAAAGFDGPLLAPLGSAAGVPRLIADALRRAAAEADGDEAPGV